MLTPLRRRPGDTPAARAVKALFRPLFKGVYYLIRGIRNHKVLSLIVILLLLASVSLTNYLTTGIWPLGIGNDQFNFHIRGSDGGGDHVKNWLYALRDGDASTLSLIGQETAQYVDLATSGTSAITISPRDTGSLINSFSQSKTHLTWKNITVLAVSSAPDTTVDSFVEVDTASSGPGGNVSGIMIWHFITAPQGTIIAIGLVSFRAPM